MEGCMLCSYTCGVGLLRDIREVWHNTQHTHVIHKKSDFCLRMLFYQILSIPFSVHVV